MIPFELEYKNLLCEQSLGVHVEIILSLSLMEGRGHSWATELASNILAWLLPKTSRIAFPTCRRQGGRDSWATELLSYNLLIWLLPKTGWTTLPTCLLKYLHMKNREAAKHKREKEMVAPNHNNQTGILSVSPLFSQFYVAIGIEKERKGKWWQKNHPNQIKIAMDFMSQKFKPLDMVV